MFMELGKFSPSVKLGIVSASRNCFPRELSEKRLAAILGKLRQTPCEFAVGQGGAAVIESRADALAAAEFFKSQNCDAAVLFLGNFSPEIEDAFFVKNFPKPVMLIAAAEEDARSVSESRGDALCGLMSASLAMSKRGLLGRVYIPQNPLVDASRAVDEILMFSKIVSVIKGVGNSTIGLFGPRPRDFESCNYNAASMSSIGVEVEELGLFDLEEEIACIRAKGSASAAENLAEISKLDGVKDRDFAERLAVYERALLNFRDRLKLSGAATQCWSRQENFSKHVPCCVNSRLTQEGFPVSCENDAYSLVSQLICQYASGDATTMLDVNHTIPSDMSACLKGVNPQDVIGLFHCGNVPAKFLNSPKVCHQFIMSRMMEKGKAPDITRGTLEGAIRPSEITMLQIHGSGDKLRAYICEGSFEDVAPETFGSVGVAHIPGFMRFYRNCLLGKFHHHAAIAFSHCGGVVFEALKLLGVSEIYTVSNGLYPSENPFGL